MSTPSLPKGTPPSPKSRSRYGLVIWIAVLGFCLAALIGTYLLFVEAPPPKKIVIATGGKKGAYYKFAQQYAAELAKEGITLEVKETKGSVENLELLRDESSEVSAAIVQSGVASGQDHDHLLALGSLYREPLWVFYRGESLLYVKEPPPKKVRIATGGKKGAYYHFAQQYAQELRKEGLILEVVETKGSVENLQLLGDEHSGVSVAIVQSGVASLKDRQRLVALASLYREPLWVFYRGEQPLDRLSELAGKRIGVGPKQSGTYPIAMQLLAANGLVDAADSQNGAKATLIEDAVALAADKLHKGELDAAFFVASIETDYIKKLITDDKVRLLSFSQHEAYQRQFRFLSNVTVPAGLVNLGTNLPAKDISLVAPTAMLVVRQQAHPALTALLLTAAARVHGKGDLLSNPGEFPSAAYCDLPVSEEARLFFKTGLSALQRQPLIDRLSQLEGKHINVGPEGSGTYAVAMQLLQANGMKGKATITRNSVTDAARQLKEGKLDAAFFVAAIETDYIQDLIDNPHMRLVNFSQQDAYHRKFRFLSKVTIPEGLVNLGYDIPRQEIALVAPTAMLVIRKNLHPALAALLLTTATRVHAKGDELSNPGEFPSEQFTDIPVSEEAKHYYKSGPPLLQRFLPFWLASLVDRLKIMLIPLIMLLMPLLRAAPPLVQWRTRRKIYRWYSDLRDIDQKITRGLTGPQLEAEIAPLQAIEQQVAIVEVPLSYMEECYHLRMHLTMLLEKLQKLRAR